MGWPQERNVQRQNPRIALDAAAQGNFKKFFRLYIETLPTTWTSYIDIKPTRRRHSKRAGTITRDPHWDIRMDKHAQNFAEFLYRFCTPRFLLALFTRYAHFDPLMLELALSIRYNSPDTTLESTAENDDIITP